MSVRYALLHYIVIYNVTDMQTNRAAVRLACRTRKAVSSANLWDSMPLGLCELQCGRCMCEPVRGGPDCTADW